MSTAKQRRAAAQRKLEKQLERRQELERQRKQQTIWMSLIGVVIIIGLVLWFAIANSDDDSINADEVTSAADCGFTADAGDPPLGMPIADGEDLETSGTVNLVMETNRGTIDIELDRADAPCAVASFAHLAEGNFFDDTICHRLTTGGLAVLQCGDPTGTGTGGPGYHFAQESPVSDDPYPEGAVAMANSGMPNSTGSQFFICYESCSQALAPDYSRVGIVTEGLDIVEEIAAEGTDNGTGDGAPKSEVQITSLTLA